MFDFLTLDAWLFSVNITHICLPEIFRVTGCVKALCEIDFPHKTALCGLSNTSCILPKPQTKRIDQLTLARLQRRLVNVAPA